MTRRPWPRRLPVWVSGVRTRHRGSLCSVLSTRQYLPHPSRVVLAVSPLAERDRPALGPGSPAHRARRVRRRGCCRHRRSLRCSGPQGWPLRLRPRRGHRYRHAGAYGGPRLAPPQFPKTPWLQLRPSHSPLELRAGRCPRPAKPCPTAPSRPRSPSGMLSHPRARPEPTSPQSSPWRQSVLTPT